jgi:hypothetical protein
VDWVSNGMPTWEAAGYPVEYGFTTPTGDGALPGVAAGRITDGTHAH